MNEDKIPTAEELFEKKFNDTECFLDYDKRGLKLINDVILEHTKLHVEAALKAAAEKTFITYHTVCEDGTTMGVFKTQQEALDFANYCNEVTSLHHDWAEVTRLNGGMDKNSILSAYPLENIK